MKSNLPKILLKMSKFCLYGMILHLSVFTFVFATNGEAQTKSVNEITISLDLKKSVKLNKLIGVIEDSSGFSFSQIKQEINTSSYSVSLESGEYILGDLLRAIAGQTGLSFHRVNEYIQIRKGSSEIESVTEVIKQLATITGRVTDENGEPLIGATVVIKGTTNGVITDIDGRFSLDVDEGETLLISFLGFLSQEVVVNNQTEIVVALQPDLETLEEVVVLGYGTASKKEVTSAVVSVDSEDFNRGNVNDPVQLLQGKVAGLSIARPGGDPNAGFAVRLRGLSTFGANSSPLVVIDGVLGGSLQLVDPNDIESIEVLKDASAAAIYGSRGASGVIIVTTKGAQGGTPEVNFSSYVAFEEIAYEVPTATAEQYLEAGGFDSGSETDWLDEVTRTGVNHVHNLSLSSGMGTGSYRVSINSRNVEGIAIGSGFNQINARLGITQTAINDKLKIDLNLGVNKRKSTFVPYEGMRYAIIADPTAPIFLNNDPEQGYWEPTATPEYQNPVGIMNEVTDDGVFKRQLATARLEYELIDGLSVAGFYSLQSDSDMRSRYFSSKTRFTSEPGGRGDKFAEFRDNQLLEFTGTFKKALTSDISINAVAGYSYQKFQFDNFFAFNSNFITDDVLYNDLELGLGTATGQDNLAGLSSQKEESILISFFGRAMINIGDAYFISGTLRREGSSKFGSNNRWGNFYAVSGGADLAKIFDIPMVSQLKLRAGYGVTGNLPNQNYEYRVRLAPAGRIEYADRFLQNVNFSSNPNPDLKWEQKAEMNFGLDFTLTNRISGSVDYYERNTTDVLRSIGVAQPPNFFPNTLLNIGELESKGLEVALNYGVVESRDLDINTGLVFSTNTTKVVVIDGDIDAINIANLGPPGLNGTLVVRFAEGEEIGQIVAPLFLGLNEDGTRNVVDQNGDGNIDQDNDAVVVGKGLPDFELASNSSIRWKSFDLSMVWRGVFGHDLVNINRAYYESPAQSGTGNIVRTKYYQPELTEAEDWNDYYVEDADFVKLDNITIGYSPKINSEVIKNFRVYFTAQNPIVITGYTGVDPEVRYSLGGDNLAPGVEARNSYFRTRTWQLGFNISF